MTVTDYLSITDENGNTLTDGQFGQLKLCDITDPMIIVLNNISGLELNRILVKPDISILQQGSVDDTINSTYISVDGQNYLSQANISIPIDGSQKIYIQWQPRWIANIGSYHWALEIDVMEAEGESLC